MESMDECQFITKQRITPPLLNAIMNVRFNDLFLVSLSSPIFHFLLACDGDLVFEHGEAAKIISIPIINDLEQEKNESFTVELLEPLSGGAQLGKHRRAVVTIINDDGMRPLTEIIVFLMPEASLQITKV